MGIPVAAAVDVIINFAATSGHTSEQENFESGIFQGFFGEGTRTVARPQQFHEKRRNHAINVNAKDINRNEQRSTNATPIGCKYSAFISKRP